MNKPPFLLRTETFPKKWLIRLSSFVLTVILILFLSFASTYWVGVGHFFVCLGTVEALRASFPTDSFVNCLAWGLFRGALTVLFLTIFTIAWVIYMYE